MTLARMLLIVTLSTGCASVSQTAVTARDPAQLPPQTGATTSASTASSAGETRGFAGANVSRERDGDTETVRHDQDAAPLRHFYLLAPGPNATLVVTRSDLPLR